MHWVDLLNKPEWVVCLSPETRTTLDILEELVCGGKLDEPHSPDYGGYDRFCVMSDLLRGGVRTGLITHQEAQELTYQLAQVM